MPYVNPIPYVDAAKEFELRLKLHFDEVIEVDEAKKYAAEFIKNCSVEELCEHLSCKMFPVYPD